MRIVAATRNRGKLLEMKRILSGTGIELLDAGDFPRFPEVREEGETFLENAMSKAEAVHSATGLPALADDSGIEVDALGGAPGVKSARYGGEGLSDEQRCAKLLEALEGVPKGERGARFRCVMVLYPLPGKGRGAITTEGILHGIIAFEPAGVNGFGYDPVFIVPERGITVAQMGPDEKDSISHRYRALVEMKAFLAREFGSVR